MFSMTTIMEADEETLERGLAYCRSVKALIEAVWQVIRQNPDAETLELLAVRVEEFPTSASAGARAGATPLVDVLFDELPSLIRTGDYARAMDHSVIYHYDDAVMTIGMICYEQMRRKRQGVRQPHATTIRF